MGLCVFGELKDYEMINFYNGDIFFCFWYGEGMYYYSNGDMYKG